FEAVGGRGHAQVLQHRQRAAAARDRSLRGRHGIGEGVTLAAELHTVLLLRPWRSSVVVVVGPVDWGQQSVRAGPTPNDRPLVYPPSCTASRRTRSGLWALWPWTPRFPQVSTDLSTRRGARAVLDPVDQLVHLVEHHPFLRHLVADLLARVHHRGVVAPAELLGDAR